MDNAKRIQKMESAVAALKSQAKVAARKLRVAKLKATLKAKRDASKHHPKVASLLQEKNPALYKKLLAEVLKTPKKTRAKRKVVAKRK